MKQLSLYYVVDALPKANFILFFSAAILAVNLLMGLNRSHEQHFLGAVTVAPQIEFRAKELAKGIQQAPVFDDELFKRAHLFNYSGKKVKGPGVKAFVLLGVSLGDKRLAMIKDAQDNKEYYCKEGDSIGVFKVKQILKDKVILESGEKTLEINQ